MDTQTTKHLPVMEAFYTVQGEGAFSGQASYFIRLGGCDVGCVWCDVKDSWSMDAHPFVSVNEIVQAALQYPARLVIITGGEPALHNLEELTQGLKDNNFHINIETSGSSPLSGHLDWVCLSPKKFKAPLVENYAYADELKVIVYNKHDLLWAKEEGSKVPDNCLLYLQPEWSKREEMMPLMVEFVKSNPQWRIGLQSHKYLNIP